MDKEKLKAKYADIFAEVFGSLGESHGKKADAIGTSRATIADRMSGRSMPSQFERILLCAVVSEMRRSKNPKAILNRGLLLKEEFEI